MSVDCTVAVAEELKRLRNIEKLLKSLVLLFSSPDFVSSLGLEP